MVINGRSLPRQGRCRSRLGQHYKPQLSNLLWSLGLDVAYQRGEGDFLYYLDQHNREIQVLDVAGGYGSLLLGHHHPELLAEAQQLLCDRVPIHAQGSLRKYAERLAGELSRRARGDYCAVFANSGAEAVEAALRHAILETGASTFLALEGAFHGKTLGARQLNGRGRSGAGLDSTPPVVAHVRLNDIDHLESTFAGTSDPAGFIFEPVLGEGGVWPVEPAFAQRAAELCALRKIPLIADECQTGLGRTGDFLRCHALGVQPDYVILSKALGGGLAKISAVLIGRARYVDGFDLMHTSTFADDDFSSGIALKTLELVDAALLADCRRKGHLLLRGLRQLKQAYPGLICDVRGVGLMAGIQFRRLARSPSFLLRYLSSQEHLLGMLAGHLFNVHDIRVAPALNDRWTLRIQPSALIHESQIDRLVAALDDTCGLLAAADTARLTQPLLDRATEQPAPARSKRPLFAYDADQFQRNERCKPAKRVAWLCHLIDAVDLPVLEPSFARLPIEKCEEHLNRFGPLAGPVVMSAVDIRSQTGDVVRLYPILLPITSQWIKRQLGSRGHEFVQQLVQNGIDAARALGCSIAALGQYTSIATNNGRRTSASGIGLTTGNSYAVALATSAIRRAEAERGGDPADSVLAVVGAAGNIGRACVEILAPRYRKAILIGSNTPSSSARLREYASRIPNAEFTTDLAAIAAADVVMAATNSVDLPLGSSHFADGAIVCDVSVPPSVRRDTETIRPDITLIKGGIVRLPHGESLQIAGFPLPPGQTYGCMAEGILLGFEGKRDSTFTGPISPHHVHRIEAIARRHGFELVDERKAGVGRSPPRGRMHAETG